MIAVGQLSDIVTQRVLSRMPSGTLSTFGYAFKLLLLVSIMPTSLATVIFPALAEAQERRAHPGSADCHDADATRQRHAGCLRGG